MELKTSRPAAFVKKGSLSMISRDLARKFIEQVTQYTEYNVNIMDADGTIIASRDPGRVGQFHEVAWRILQGQEAIVMTTDARDYSTVLPGINMVIEDNGIREGVVGVTGDPEEIRPVALIIKMAIETMLRYERSQQELRLRRSRKERFVHLLTQEEHSDPAELRQMAEELGYHEEIVRIPILVRTRETDTEKALDAIRTGRVHTKEDISFTLSPHHFVIFKTLPTNPEQLFAEYRELIMDYLDPFLKMAQNNKNDIRVSVGSLQNRFPGYYSAYQHCRWLEQKKAGECPAFFQDYIGEYLEDAVPMKELYRIYHLYEKLISREKRAMIRETAGALLKTNFNFPKAAAMLFIHKNTLVYRYGQLKEFLRIDPVISSIDRSFLGGFYLYLARRGEYSTDQSDPSQ